MFGLFQKIQKIQKNIQKNLLVGLLLVVLCVAGCQMVHVTDPSGNAINMAKVSTATQTSGASGMVYFTNFLGDVALPLSQTQPGEREWLEISKEGYIPRKIARPEVGKVEVQLIKASGTLVAPDNAETK